ncbi:ABC transporter ATP-binding protein [Methanothrix thermoacetophila]|uniref:Oligopeptide/dipeptide ABC transporter, ATPase subunit n=1 Tax=Methanothrix thermoacetophila (strain DSM 6194 / JCM 14653 / NBRC 101360 / PT) TaxID=349307 RepID=A0B7H1_METTP|nr:ABC transporter ATP-binding protein [Methanothrix thermoacetophila]ABK14645.1 oligopeptide/dipeptide ABC transporter, ATPase subunit [Methanothrix thermoacetophila PT]
MLEVIGLRARYGENEVLKGIDLRLERGDSLAVVGESGAGKTTLGLSIMRLAAAKLEGEIVFDGTNLLELSEDEMRRLRGDRMAMVFQNVEDALDPVYTAEEQVCEAIAAHNRWNKSRIRERARALLTAVGLDGTRYRLYPHQLSGGERQRVLIAMALANDPELLILDEPTASLDALTKADIVELLRSATSDRISLIITHDISLASALSKKIAVLYSGMILEVGRTADLIRNPRHPYTRGLLRSFPSMNTTKDLQGIPGRTIPGISGCPFHPRCTQKIEVCRNLVPRLAELNGRMIACHRGGIVPLLEIRDVCKKFNGFSAVSHVSLTLYEGETLALVGESGSGKTTLAKIIMGIIEPDSGEILLERERARWDAGFYRRVQMIFQNPKESISHRLNVLQAVREPLDVQRIGSEEERIASAMKALENAELSTDPEFLRRYPHQLSGGEAQRVAIARALVMHPKLLIADEPTSALDPSVQAKILRLLMDLQERMGLSILFITHDIALARKVSDRIAVMLRGSIVEEGPSGEVIREPAHRYTASLVRCAAMSSVMEERAVEQ